MATIAQIEDQILSTITGLGTFKQVQSAGRKERPTVLNYPAAFAYFVEAKNTGTRPRPVFEETYEVVVVNKNLKSESAAADDTYSFLDSVRDAINGKSLTFTDIEPFQCDSISLIDYEAGVISYALQFKTRHFLAVPTDT